MKIKLLKLYSDPEVFKPITFNDGINLIMGEKVSDGNIKKANKTNGVGKTLCVEFINYCLLKTTTHCRVNKIPIENLPEDVWIILDMEINLQKMQIKRKRKSPENPIITANGVETEFSNLDDAQKYLKELLFKDFDTNTNISFREFLAPFLREEGSEFKDILMCFENTSKIPPSVKANAFLFNIDTTLIDLIKRDFGDIKKLKSHKTELKNILTEKGKKKLSDIKATINSLKDDLNKIDLALESFKTNQAFEVQQDNLSNFQNEIESLRNKQSALKYQLKKISSFPELESISEREIEIVYNQFKSGLGNIVAKSIEEVKKFKQKIDDFQNRLFNEKISSLSDELRNTTQQVNTLEEKRAELIKIIDQKGVLKDIKNGYAIFHKKKEDYSSISSRYEDYEKSENRIKSLILEKDGYFLKLDSLILEAKDIIENFNETILSIHEYIMDSNKASFDIKTVSNSQSEQVLQFEMRIDDDGSHSVNRTKVFIYDLALMFNDFTSKRHPKLLVHDNIFDVDQDTLIKSLNYLVKSENTDFQYILTLNRDKVENEEKIKALQLDIELHKVANFTKQNRFLFGDGYSEI